MSRMRPSRILFLSVGLAISLSFAVFARPVPLPKLLISVESLADPSDEWARRACRTILESASKARPYDAQCVRIDDIDELVNDSIGKAERSGEFRYHLQLREAADGQYRLLAENWSRDEGEFARLEWTVRPRPREDAWRAIDGILFNLMSYDANESSIKAIVLAGGLGESERIRPEQREVGGKTTAVLVDARNGETLTDEAAYALFVQESPRTRNYMRASLEIGAGLSLAMISYWHHNLLGDGAEKNPNAVDWEYRGWEGQRRKYRGFDGFRYDDNSRGINVGHSFAGMMYYTIARSNNFSSAESFLAALAASSLWEVAGEYREVISINDTIFTPIGGAVLGEVAHQFGRYFHAKNTLAGKFLSTVFDSPAALNRLLDSRGSNGGERSRDTGFDHAGSGHFDLYAGATRHGSGDRGSGATFGARGEILNIPLFEEAGRVRQLYTDTTFAELLLEYTHREGALDEFRLLSKAVFAAFHDKNLKLDDRGRREGYSMSLGMAGAWTYDSRENAGKRPGDDWLATVHVLGSSLDLVAFVKGVRLRMTADVYGDFAMVRSFAIDGYRKADPKLEGTSSTLRLHDYYFASGLTQAGSFEIGKGRFNAGYRYRFSEFASVNSRSRDHEQVTRELELKDSSIRQEIFVSYDLGRNWKIEISLDKTRRRGSIDGFGEVSRSETRKMGKLIYVF
ncbi:MAG: DUF3943 domain-containing protein [Oligoflexia bacterium]|nr:DUF3943 domain-containing protein [Oligoflexia bacterium]